MGVTLTLHSDSSQDLPSLGLGFLICGLKEKN